MAVAVAGSGAPGLFEVPALPGTPIGRRLTLLEGDGVRAVFYATTAIQVFDTADRAAEAACIAMLSRAGLASDVDIAAAFGCHRNTVARLAGRLANEGMAAVVPAKRGPKGPSKVTPAVVAVIAAEAARLGGRRLVDAVAARTGVRLSVSYVQRLAAEHRGRQLELAGLAGGEPGASGAEPGTAEDTDLACTDADTTGGAGEPAGAGSGGGRAGVGAPPGERGAFDPPAVLPARVRGRYMGLALYYPALTALGLVDVARGVFRLPRSERFGVRAVTLCVFFLTLLRRPTVEAAKHLRRAEFGAVLGSGRAPAVKTLRRKFAELVAQAKAAEFGVRLARRWVESGIVATAYLYVDGHMQAYTGKRHLAKVWNPQRRMPLPGVHTYHVADAQGRPVLFLTEELSTNLARAMPRIIDAIREVLGARAFTVIFDRGGYDGDVFSSLTAQGISFITYQKGTPNLPPSAFARREARFEGRRVRFQLAEDEAKVNGKGPWRRVVVRTPDGHQTPILTNLGVEVGPARIACLMFARWRQENVFKYMGAHHGLDCLISYAAGPADPHTLVPNPPRQRLDRHIAQRRKDLTKLSAVLAALLLEEPNTKTRRAHRRKITPQGVVGQLRAVKEDIAALLATRDTLPTHVPIADTGTGREVMRLEHKTIVDHIKISAYNAEEWLLDRLIGHYPNPHDARDLLRSFAELTGEIATTDDGVEVTLDPPDTPIHRRALQGLIEDLNTHGATYPGTDTPVTYHLACTTHTPPPDPPCPDI